MQETPVYLFTGFLEAGKTAFIQETLEDPKFNEGEGMLVILCEEGEVEYDPSKYPKGGKNVSFVTFENEEVLTPDRLSAAAKRAKADRILVEYNGVWNIDSLYRALPDTWFVCEEIFLADSTTILSYNANMRQMVYDKLQSAQMVIFNRMKEDADQMPFHKLVRAVNRRCGIGYEYVTGEFVPDEIEDPLPFDITAPVITIADKDYAIWYADLAEHMDRYAGKTVSFKGQFVYDKDLGPHAALVGRRVMTCCEADIAYRPLFMHTKEKFMNGTWVSVTATLKVEEAPVYEGQGPVLYAVSVRKTDAPEEEIATYY